MNVDKEFFKNITDRAKEVAVYAGEVAKSAAETAKINVRIANENHNIEKAYKEIGEWFCNEHEGEYPEAIRDIVENIKAAKLRVAELKEQIGEDKEESVGTKVCPNCGTAAGSAFCPNCGTRLD